MAARKVYRRSATGAAQAKRQAWGREWGAINKQIGADIRAKRKQAGQ